MPAPWAVSAPQRGFALCMTIGLLAACAGVVLLPLRPAHAAPGPDQGQIAMGDTFGCAVRSDGLASCWGPIAAPPADLGTVTRLAAMKSTACAIRTDQAVRCWGDNANGEASPPAGLTAVAFGSGQSDSHLHHVCAVKPDGSLVCWGLNDAGQTDVPSDLGTVTGASTGDGFSCAVRSDQTVRCWGSGATAVPSDLGPVTSLASSNHNTCAVLTDRTLRCWGPSNAGEATPPSDVDPVAALAPLIRGFCAIRSPGGDVHCWGSDGGTGAATPPSDLGAARAIAAGFREACATLTTGRLRCWGPHFEAAPALTSGPPPSGVGHGVAYSHTFTASGAPAPRFTVTAGSLPPGLALDAVTGRLTGTPTTPGTFTATVMASNEFFAPDATQSISIVVTNAAPTAGNDTYNAVEDTPLSIAAPGVRTNDADADGDAITATVAANPAHGQVNLQTDGAFTYTPAANFNGSDSFTYVVTDAFGAQSSPATVSLTVAPVNDAPVAHDDSLTTAEDTAKAVTVTANDTDADGDTLSAVAAGGPVHGHVDCTGGACTYTPDANYNGSDAFSYNAVDGHGGSSAAQVTVAVTAVNDPPVAVDDADTTPEDTPIDLAVVQNDSDVDGDTLSVTANSQPANGVALCSGTSCHYGPGPDFNGTDAFTYTVSDGHGGTGQATVHVTISAENDAPVATADGWTGAEDTLVAVTAPGVLGNDRDADGDTLTARLVTGVSHGRLTLRPDGSLDYTPDADFNGDDSFTYQANDGSADSAPTTVALHVTAVNDVPVPVDDTATGPEGTPVAIAVTANDHDADGDVIALLDVDHPAHGTVSCDGQRVCTYRSRVPFSGVDSFGYRVGDGKGGEARGTVRVTVTPVRGQGYWVLGEDGHVYSFGTATSYGDAAVGGARATDIDPTPTLNGYWVTDDRGGVHPAGDAATLGAVDPPALRGGESAVALAVTGTGQGYWLVTDQGRIFSFGDAGRFGDLGSLRLAAPIVDATTSAGGAGLYLVASDGGIFAFGDARFAGSLGGRPLGAPVVSVAADPDGSGYWLAGADGGVFAFDAPFLGSVPPRVLNRPLAQIVPGESGYVLAARDGGVFAFGPPYLGSLGDHPPATPIVAVGTR